MTAKNDITGDSIRTKGVTEAYLNNYDLIFGKKKSKVSDTTDELNAKKDDINERKDEVSSN